MEVRMAEASEPQAEREAADDLAVDDGGPEVGLGAVVGRLDVVAVEEDVQAVAMEPVALPEPRGLGLGRRVAVEH
jgi:hypothetical protein